MPSLRINEMKSPDGFGIDPSVGVIYRGIADFSLRSAEGYVENHHQAETRRVEQKPRGTIFSLDRFRDQFFHRNVDHCARGKGEKIREKRQNETDALFSRNNLNSI